MNLEHEVVDSTDLRIGTREDYYAADTIAAFLESGDEAWRLETPSLRCRSAATGLRAYIKYHELKDEVGVVVRRDETYLVRRRS